MHLYKVSKCTGIYDLITGYSTLTLAEKIADWMDFWDANHLRVEVGLKPSV